jgi:hypothetical protein
MKIDQDQGPLGERRDARYNGSLELEHDWARPDAPQRQFLEAHRLILTSPAGRHDDRISSLSPTPVVGQYERGSRSAEAGSLPQLDRTPEQCEFSEISHRYIIMDVSAKLALFLTYIA